MIFVIDIGNTHTVSGISKRGVISKQWRLKTDSSMTADELGINYHNLFLLSGIDINSVEGVIVSSVVPQLNAAYFSCFATLFPNVSQQNLFNVNHANVSSLISIVLENPAEVGADRLVNGIGAFDICKTSAVVIDFGTAITFDCISHRCEYLGGLILPGLKIALQALTTKAAKLPQIDISTPPEKIIGTNTVMAMKSGVLNGYGVMIEGLIHKVLNEMAPASPPDTAIIATGGMAPLIKPYAPSIQLVEPDLTLKGLIKIYHELTV